MDKLLSRPSATARGIVARAGLHRLGHAWRSFRAGLYARGVVSIAVVALALCLLSITLRSFRSVDES